ncbi:MAG: MgtC/SapB family protein [Acidobacteria bacterium]|nr:MgtC/SapB family protein [Acidobacteriota bacterium]
MDIIFEELVAGMPDTRQLVRVIIRLLFAALLGAVVGIQRERTGKPAGLRTHMLVSLGAALFVLAPTEIGMDSDGLSRVIQGLATGIGFIGGGAILKLHDQREIEGLTTAAGIWMTAAVGVAVGLGRLGLALISMALAWFILAVIGKYESRISEGQVAKTADPKK